MIKINVYDFDGTLYSKDSSIEFFRYCLKKNKKLIKYVPGIILLYILNSLKLVKKEKLKEYFFRFLKDFDNVNLLVKDFWTINKKYLRQELIKDNKNKKVVVSASPTFLLKDICKEIGIDKVVASKISEKDGKFESLNCYGREKIKRLDEEYNSYEIVNFYSDSVSDIKLAEKAENAYFIKDDKIYEFNSDNLTFMKALLNNITFIYLTIPIIIFLFGWIKLWIAIILSIFLMISTIHRINECRIIRIDIRKYLKENKNAIIVTLIITAFLVFLSGVGGIVYQNEDYVYRNSIFLDLIKYKWPIYLPAAGNFTKEVMMVYYFALWLPAALMGKVFGTSFGFFALYLWCLIGVYITLRYLKLYYKKSYIIPIIIFFGFSGLDIVERFLYGQNILDLINSTTHLEWTTGYQFSSIITQLFWVFNQAIPAWLITLLMLNERNNKRLLVLLSYGLIFATLPTVGLFFVVLYKMYFDEKVKLSINYFISKTKKALSLENILIGIPIAIILITFVTSNSTSSLVTIGIANYNILAVIVTMLCELLVYYYFVIRYTDNKRLIIISSIILFICPFIRINNAGDFCMRASIPSLVILITLLLESLSKMDRKSIEYKVFIVIFILGMMTPLNEIRRTIANTNYTTTMPKTRLITSKDSQNFYGYKDESLFVKYFAKQ